MNLKTIQVPLGKNSYPIWIQNGLINSLMNLLNPLNKGQTFVLVCQPPVHELIGEKLISQLTQNGYDVKNLIIKDNESAKSIKHADYCWNKLIEFGCDRSSILIALGGGVTGDLTGFLASTLFRGIQYVQIPTTLLAMVDSSIGGKTGVNLNEGKNLIGTFHQPNSVIIDPELLMSLPEIEINSGMGEVIKYGAIKDPNILSLVLSWIRDGSKLNDKRIVDLIRLSCEIKSEIVVRDEKENNIRRILNFGHTFGHALEAATEYKYFTHGEAVMHGMRFAIRLSQEKFKLPIELFNNLITCIELLNIKPVPELSHQGVMELMMKDKKRVKNKINFILLSEPGKPVILDDIPINTIGHHIETYLQDFS